MYIVTIIISISANCAEAGSVTGTLRCDVSLRHFPDSARAFYCTYRSTCRSTIHFQMCAYAEVVAVVQLCAGFSALDYSCHWQHGQRGHHANASSMHTCRWPTFSKKDSRCTGASSKPLLLLSRSRPRTISSSKPWCLAVKRQSSLLLLAQPLPSPTVRSSVVEVSSLLFSFFSFFSLSFSFFFLFPLYSALLYSTLLYASLLEFFFVLNELLGMIYVLCQQPCAPCLKLINWLKFFNQ